MTAPIANGGDDRVNPPTHTRNEFLAADFPTVTHTPEFLRQLILCGPLLRYTGTDYSVSNAPVWRGSVLVVTHSHGPSLTLTYDDKTVPAERLWEERGRAFLRFPIATRLHERERKVVYQMDSEGGQLQRSFWIPGRDETMRMMFHSCNGFSVGSDEEAFSGPALWNDVLRLHSEVPFHVMIGGGDQIYNDGIRVSGPLKSWADMKNPVKRRRYPWTQALDDEVDEWYCNNYLDWYSTVPFSHANSQIPQVNIWDDHDIIDGYGSYTDDFMGCAVFKGVGKVAHKYYMLIQHHTPPLGDQNEDPSWVIGRTPGRYCERHSRSIYARFGRKVAFLGVDARAERTRHQINLPETYEQLFRRAEEEIDASQGEIRHLVVLLGVPIAYPRLVWLENILTSPILGFIRFLNKRFGIADSMFNNFDGEVDILDDLDDHYCARPHKRERNDLLMRFQNLSKTRNVRITFLSGDVHLAAVGRFYSKPSLNITTEHDHRYMVNVISSAITNKPPPKAVSNILARRNKIHHLDRTTDEQLLDFFDKGVHGEKRPKNQNTMPSRNFAVLTEGMGTISAPQRHETIQNNNGQTKNAVSALEVGAGAEHPAAAAGKNDNIETGEGALNVAIRVEIDKSDHAGKTFAYGFAIPALEIAAT